ncbi:MAG: nucleotidyltransferase family protein [Granulosicoccus sp.]
MSLLDHCPSAEHRAALRLTGIALGGAVEQELLQDLSQTDPVRLATIANVEHVHCVWALAEGRDSALGAALPEDLWLYLNEMTRANAVRVHKAREQLAWTGELFADAGIHAVVLKGGADLLDPPAGGPEHRFISDLDILVPGANLEAARDLMLANGAKLPADATDTPADHHHLPAFYFPDREFPVELHFRVGEHLVASVLPADEVLSRAIPSALPGIWLPSDPDRVVHHVLHASIMRHDTFRFYLRSLLDLHRWQTRSAEFAAATRRLEEVGQGAALHSLLGLRDLIIGRDSPVIQAEKAWLTRALYRFGKPAERQWIHLWSLLSAVVWRCAKDPSRLWHYLRLFTDRRSLSKRLSYWRSETKKLR